MSETSMFWLEKLNDLAEKHGFKRKSWQQNGPCSNWGTDFTKGELKFSIDELDYEKDYVRLVRFIKKHKL